MSMDKSVNNQLNDLEKNKILMDTKKKDAVLNDQYKFLYRKQQFGFRVEDYFLEDIYKEFSDSQLIFNITNDYIKLLTNAVDSILKNKTEFQNNYMLYDQPEALKYPYYLPLAKYAKFTIDYDKYLKYIDPQHLAVRLNIYYPNFKTDGKYFIILKTKTCSQHAHVLLFLEKAVELYLKHPIRVDQCIYNNICELKKEVPQEQQCKII